MPRVFEQALHETRADVSRRAGDGDGARCAHPVPRSVAAASSVKVEPELSEARNLERHADLVRPRRHRAAAVGDGRRLVHRERERHALRHRVEDRLLAVDLERGSRHVEWLAVQRQGQHPLRVAGAELVLQLERESVCRRGEAALHVQPAEQERGDLHALSHLPAHPEERHFSSDSLVRQGHGRAQGLRRGVDVRDVLGKLADVQRLREAAPHADESVVPDERGVPLAQRGDDRVAELLRCRERVLGHLDAVPQHDDHLVDEGRKRLARDCKRARVHRMRVHHGAHIRPGAVDRHVHEHLGRRQTVALNGVALEVGDDHLVEAHRLVVLARRRDGE